MKKWIALLMIVIMSFGFAACGSKESSGNQSGKTISGNKLLDAMTNSGYNAVVRESSKVKAPEFGVDNATAFSYIVGTKTDTVRETYKEAHVLYFAFANENDAKTAYAELLQDKERFDGLQKVNFKNGQKAIETIAERNAGGMNMLVQVGNTVLIVTEYMQSLEGQYDREIYKLLERLGY